MTQAASWMTRWAALLLLTSAPLVLAGPAEPPATLAAALFPTSLPALAQPPEEKGPPLKEVKGKPKDVDKPLGPPPKLGGPLEPGRPLSSPGGPAPLALFEVLASVDRHYPLVRAAEQERVIAAGQQTATRGAWDVNLRSQEIFGGGTYDNQRYSLFAEQQTPFHGLSYFAGYRLGAGDYPVYYGDRKTAEGGEFRAGMTLPLLRNRAIDRFRAAVAKADLDRRLAEPSIQLQRIDITRAASRAYWGWVAAGQRYQIARDILRIAEQRDAQLAFRVEKVKNLAPIEREDNRRAIVERQARLVVAQRQYEQAAIALSLYLRDGNGEPMIPPADMLPGLVEPAEPPPEPVRHAQLEAALGRRPELRTLSLQRQKVLVDLELAENQTLPGLNLGVMGAQDVGFGRRSPSSTSRLGRQTGEVAVLFDLPVQRREARGRILQAQGELARLAARERFLRDRVQLDVQDALNALDRAHDLLRRGRDNRLQAAYLQAAEVRQFNVGKSDLFRVNLRELTAAEARFLEIDAAAEMYRALADYQAALGLDPSALAAGTGDGVTPPPSGTPCVPPG